VPTKYFFIPDFTVIGTVMHKQNNQNFTTCVIAQIVTVIQTLSLLFLMWSLLKERSKNLTRYSRCVMFYQML